MVPRKFVGLSFDGPNGGYITVRERTYRLMRAGKNAEFPPVGCASIMCDSGNRRKSVKFEHLPIGNLMRDLVEGVNIAPTARKWIVIVIRDDDWKRLEELSRKSFRLIDGTRK